jgi:hypothetical protein
MERDDRAPRMSIGMERESREIIRSRGWNAGYNKQGFGGFGWHDEGRWQGPCATSYINGTRTIVCPPNLLPLGTFRFDVRPEKPYGRLGLPCYTHALMHQYVV